MSNLADVGVAIAHHFMYAKSARIPAGVVLQQHAHKHDHYSLLLEGSVMVWANAEVKRYFAPTVILIPKGVSHEVTAITDTHWWCLHETDERDLDVIDKSLIE